LQKTVDNYDRIVLKGGFEEKNSPESKALRNEKAALAERREVVGSGLRGSETKSAARRPRGLGKAPPQDHRSKEA